MTRLTGQTRTLLFWAFLGLLTGAADYFLLSSLGIQMRLGEVDAGFWVCLYLSASFGGLFFFVGQWKQSRDHIRLQKEKLEQQLAALEDSQAIIQAQMEELEQTHQKAAEHEKLALVGEMAASVAHEVRNPLGVIRSSVALLMDGVSLDDDQLRAGELIQAEIKRLNRFCTDFLQLSRPLGAKIAPVPCREVLLYLAHLVEELCTPTAIQGDVQAEGLPETLWLDQDLLRQVCQTLLVNAVQEAPAVTHLEVRLTSLEVEKQGHERQHTLRLAVMDDGPGIDMVHEAKIFRPFFTTKAQGSGLGLAVAKRLIEAHHGKLLTCQGQGLGPERQGACFVIELPCATRSQETSTDTQPETRKQEAAR